MFFNHANGRPLFRLFRTARTNAARQNSFLLPERIETGRSPPSPGRPPGLPAQSWQPAGSRGQGRPGFGREGAGRRALRERPAPIPAPPPNFFCNSAICSGDGCGDRRRPSRTSAPFGPSARAWRRPRDFIMSAMVRCCLSRRLTSSTFMPEPAAMRFLREAFRMIGIAPLLRRHRKDDRALAGDRLVVDLGGGELRP